MEEVASSPGLSFASVRVGAAFHDQEAIPRQEEDRTLSSLTEVAKQGGT
jgi:hypothetical protein